MNQINSPPESPLILIAEGATPEQRRIKHWGLSFLIGNVLFDTFGREDIFWESITRLKIDLTAIEHIVTSHDDWDHIDALAGILQKYPRLKVHICKNSAPALKETIQMNGGTLIEIEAATAITARIWSLGQMRADTGRGIVYEQALVIKSANGLLLVTGCAHPGILNLIQKATQQFKETPYAIIGGFHLKDNSNETNTRIINKIKRIGVQKVCPLHCTGQTAQRIFKKIFQHNDITPQKNGQIDLN